MLQQRIEGEDLESLWGDLSHPQRCTIAKELGKVVSSLFLVGSPVAGIVEADDAGNMAVIPWKVKSNSSEDVEDLDTCGLINANGTYLHMTAHDLLRSYYRKWKMIAIEANLGNSGEESELYDDLIKIADEMNDLGLFKEQHNCLCHLDLHNLRNIVAKLEANGTIRLTGILD